MSADKVTAPDLRAMKERREQIVALTAYDYPMARLLDDAGVDFLLVGDSVGDNVLGFDSTLPVTVEMIVHHAAAVARGTRRALVVADMPFLSYQSDAKTAIDSAGRLVRDGGAEAVKLEGAGRRSLEAIEALVDIGLPVMGHVGYTPQSQHALGRSRVRGKDADAANAVLEAAVRLQDAGCFAVVLECTPEPLGKLITDRLAIPTIGIGAGRHCDGQILILHDVLNLGDEAAFRPRFAKQYADLATVTADAVACYAAEVRQGLFPGPEHAFGMAEGELERLTAEETAA